MHSTSFQPGVLDLLQIDQGHFSSFAGTSVMIYQLVSTSFGLPRVRRHVLETLGCHELFLSRPRRFKFSLPSWLPPQIISIHEVTSHLPSFLTFPCFIHPPEKCRYRHSFLRMDATEVLSTHPSPLWSGRRKGIWSCRRTASCRRMGLSVFTGLTQHHTRFRTHRRFK